MDRIIEKKKWTRSRIITIGLVIFAAISLIFLLFFRDNQSKLYVDANQLSLAEAKLDRFQEYIPVDAIVFPKTTVYIDAVQGGTVEQVFVDDGAELKAGDTILKLLNIDMELRYMDQETRMYDAINNLQNSKVSLERSKFLRQSEIVGLLARIDQVKLDFERKSKLYADKLISDQEFEDAEREYQLTMKQLDISLELQRLDSVSMVEQTRQINNSIQRMRNNLMLLNKNLGNLHIKAPTAGILSSFIVEIGETKSAGERLGQIDIMDDGFKLRANIDERYISTVHIGQEAEFDFAGNTYQLEITKIYTNVTNGAFQVDLNFTDKQPMAIKRGQTVQMRLKFSSPRDAVIIRRGGFFQETGGNWIYVVDPSGSFALKRNIRLGRQNTNYYEVMEGLDPGEKVIISSYNAFGGKDKLIFR
ncbi:MAG: HlyD family efflux transporter periplasmic adaptor subunit [Sphingobacteriia bacterium]|nr:HlyD family efflux transporter periplasmic adaptor subunit [Sphingobacteriia bacterium]